MGRPNKELENNFMERLKWFSIDRYDGLDRLDTLGWFKQLQVRRVLYERLTCDFPKQIDAGNESPGVWNDARTFLSLVQENPILDIEDEPTLEREIPQLRMPVHATTIEEFYLGELDAQHRRVQKARRFFKKAQQFRFEVWRDGYRLDFSGSARDVASVIDSELTAVGKTAECTVLDHSSEDSPSEEYFFDEEIRLGKWAESPLHDFLGLRDVGIITVDYRMPNSVLVEHFLAVVDKLKTEQQKIRDKKLNLAEWVRCGLLPYIDLELWRLTNALPKYGKDVVRIPNSLMKRLVLKEDASPNSKHLSSDHTIRAVTRKTFNELFSRDSVLFDLLESEAAGQFHSAGITSRSQRYKMRKRRDEKRRKIKSTKVKVE